MARTKKIAEEICCKIQWKCERTQSEDREKALPCKVPYSPQQPSTWVMNDVFVVNGTWNRENKQLCRQLIITGRCKARARQQTWRMCCWRNEKQNMRIPNSHVSAYQEELGGRIVQKPIFGRESQTFSIHNYSWLIIVNRRSTRCNRHPHFPCRNLQHRFRNQDFDNV